MQGSGLVDRYEHLASYAGAAKTNALVHHLGHTHKIKDDLIAGYLRGGLLHSLHASEHRKSMPWGRKGYKHG
jgi:hypothetical protein